MKFGKGSKRTLNITIHHTRITLDASLDRPPNVFHVKAVCEAFLITENQFAWTPTVTRPGSVTYTITRGLNALQGVREHAVLALTTCGHILM